MKDSTAERLLCPTLTKLRWKPCNACCVVCHVVMYLCDNNICAAVTDADVRPPRVFMVFVNARVMAAPQDGVINKRSDLST